MSKFVVKDFDRDSFPALYRSADSASRDGQWWYLTWLRVNLALLVLAALVGSVGFDDLRYRQTAYAIAAAIFVCSMGTTILLASKRWERMWYGGRAVAESAKSMTWKFICGAQPFGIEYEEKEAVSRLSASLSELVQENKPLAFALSNSTIADDQVTEFMLGLRGSVVGVRRDVYLSQRVNEQMVWYAKESESNKKRRNTWFAALVLFQALAGAGSIFLAIYPMFSWKVPALFGALASVTVAWGQTKRYQELSQAYGLAAQELSLIAARGKYVQTNEELARFVNDAETAISREHSMWVSRRETK